MVSAQPAHADYTYWYTFTCNGQMIRRAPFRFRIDTVTIPPGSPQHLAAEHAIAEMQAAIGSTVLQGWYDQLTNGTRDGGISEIAIVDPRSIDGVGGRTVLYYQPACPKDTWGNPFGIYESDIRIAAWGIAPYGSPYKIPILYSDPPAASLNFYYGAPAFLHEMGHAMNLGHSEGFDMMRGGDPTITIGGGGYRGTTVKLAPDDIKGLNFLYGAKIPIDLFVSSLVVNWDSTIEPGNVPKGASNIMHVCRGQNIFPRFTFGNRGYWPVDMSIKVEMKSAPAYVGYFDTWPGFVLGTTGGRLAGWQTVRMEGWPLRIPFGAQVGTTYWLYYSIAPAAPLSYGEVGFPLDPTGDNKTHSQLEIHVDC